MTTVKMCDNCKQIINDTNYVFFAMTWNNYIFTIDCHTDCAPDWMKTIHEEQMKKPKPTTVTIGGGIVVQPNTSANWFPDNSGNTIKF